LKTNHSNHRKPSGQVDSVQSECSGHIAARQNQGIRETFKHYKEESLTHEEQFGDKYSWDELRMFKSKFELILKGEE
jgi:hypothetical protein